MRGISFNTGWTWRHLEEEGPGAPVTLPHDAMQTEPRSPAHPGGSNTGWYAGRDYRYEKRFTLPEALLTEQLTLEMEGVYQRAEVWLNGEKLTERPYGYTNFYADLTGRVQAGENTLAVIARNSAQPNSRWYTGAGIYRPVTLWHGGAAHIPVNGVRVETLSASPARVRVSVRTSQPGEAEITVINPHGRVVRQARVEAASQSGAAQAAGQTELELRGALLWSPEQPNLYQVRVRFGEDEETVPLGIRTLAWGENGFLINGRRVILQGACMHHDNGIIGARCEPAAVERKVRALKECGYNAIRSAHNPCSKALLAVCDRLGVMVLDEYADQWYIHKTRFDYAGEMETWWRQDLTDMVDKDFNHPCVVMYSTGNEVAETARKKGIALTGEMTEFLHSLDGTRPVTCGVNLAFNGMSAMGLGVYSDKKALKAARKAEQGGQGKAVGSQFFNNLTGMLGDSFMKRAATLRLCDVKTRDAFARLDIAGYNYGIDRYERDLKRYPQRLILGSETYCKDAWRFRELAKDNPRLIGDFVWAGIDYLGEAGLGAWEYPEDAPTPVGCGWVAAGAGRLDLCGNPWGEALYTRVALAQDKGPWLAVWPVNHTGDSHTPAAWRMSNARPTWSWNGCEWKEARVEVYARASEVALLLNGQEVGRQPLKDGCVARFTLTWAPGRLEAVAYDARGRVIGRRALVSAGEETVLRAEPEVKTAAPGDLCYIRLRYTDMAGRVKPLEKHHLRSLVSGGELLGFGSACPYNAEGFASGESETYYGEALAAIRADGAGDVVLTVTDEEGRAANGVVRVKKA